MTEEKRNSLKALIKDFPVDPGVYLMRNAGGKIIYVGKAKDLRARVRSYLTNNKDHSPKTIHLVKQIHEIAYILTNTEVEAFLLEASLIKKHRPKYNIRLKDDKAYPYIRCSTEMDFPRFYLARRVKMDGATYFGPYTSSYAVRETIRFLNRTFNIRDCTDHFMRSRKRPCMTYQIGRCTAPCVNYVTREQYGKDVEKALEFLKGEDQKIIKQLAKDMRKAANEERFEAAAKIRDSLQAIERVREKQSVINTAKQDRDQDVIAYYGDQRGTLVETLHIRKGRVIGNRHHFITKLNHEAEGEDPREWLTSFLNQYYSDNIIPDEVILSVDLGHEIVKLLNAVFFERQAKRATIFQAMNENETKLVDMALGNARSHFLDQVSKREDLLQGLEDIRIKLKLPELPQRIECYDISNFQGEESVASQVVFEEGLPKKEDYRRYKIKTVQGADDFASMKEVLTRRFRHTEYEEPDLVVIDGGKGQLKMAVEVMKELNHFVPVVGMAKARTKGAFQDQQVEKTEERFFLPGRQNPVTFSHHSQALQILIGIRDEAHRFAISYHRKLRQNRTLESELDAIIGLGEKRKTTLLKRFDNIQQIRQASTEEIAGLPGMNRVLAERILLQLSQQDQF